MALWDIVDIFNAEDETIQFGTRNFAENGDSIFESTTMAVIKPSSEVNFKPKISALSNNSRIILTIDKTITVLKDEDCEHLFSLGFESEVDCFTVAPKSKMYIFCLGDGSIVGLHSDSGQFIFSVCIERSDVELGISCFVQIIPVDNHYFIACRSGQTYSLFGVNEEKLSEAVLCGDEPTLNSLREKVSVIKVRDTPHGARCANSALVLQQNYNGTNNSLMELIVGQQVFHNYEDNITMFSFDKHVEGIKKVQNFSNFNKVVGLTYSGEICILDPFTLNIVFLPELTFIQDFIVINASSPEESDGLLLLCKKDGEETCLLKLLNFPSMAVKYNLIVPSTTFLIQFDGLPLELNYLEAINKSNGGFKEIRVKALVESSPDFRLQRLINRGRFNEAEEFANRFHLSTEVVFQAKIKKFLEDLYCIKDGKVIIDVKTFEDLIFLLQKVTDKVFVVDNCLLAVTFSCNPVAIRHLLDYTLKRIDGDSKMVKELERIYETLRRLETFELLQQESLFMNWEDFSKVNMLEACLQHLKMENIEIACCLWSRHFDSIDASLSSASVEILLDGISNNLHPGDIMPWLRHFVPSVMQTQPNSFAAIIDWTLRKAISMEKTKVDEWPQIGLDFTEAMLSLFSDAAEHCDKISNVDATMDSRLVKLFELKQIIKDLITLRVEHLVRVPLKTYMQVDLSMIAIDVLKRTSVECVSKLLKEFVGLRLLTQGIQPDTVVERCIQDELYSHKDESWENRITAYVNCLQGEHIRLKYILVVLNEAPVPWSDKMTHLANRGINSNDPIAADILAVQNHIGLKLILLKYKFPISKEIEYISWFLINRILDEARPEMMEDIKQIVLSEPSLGNQFYSSCITHFLRLQKPEMVLDILDGLDRTVKLYCCQIIVSHARYLLKSKKPIQDKNKVNFDILRSISKRLTDLNELGSDIELIQNVYKLKEEFNIHHDMSSYYLMLHDDANIDNGILNIFDDLSTKRISIEKAYEKAKRLAQLYNFSSTTGLSKLVKLAKDFDITKKISELLLASESCSESNYLDFGSLACRLILQCGNFNQKHFNPEEIFNSDQTMELSLHLTNKAVYNEYHVESSGLLQMQRLASLSSLYFTGGLQPMRLKSLAINVSSSNDIFSRWHLSNVYSDSAVCSDNEHVLKCVSQSVIALLKYHENTNVPIFKDVNFKDSSYTNSSDEDFCSNLTLNNSLKRLVGMQHQLTAFQIALTINNFSKLIEPKTEPIISDVFINKLSKELLHKMCGLRKFEKEGALAVLGVCSDPRGILTEMGETSRTDAIRSYNVSSLGLEYEAYTGGRLSVAYKQMLDNKLRCSWAMKLSKSKLNMRAVSLKSNNWHMDVLKILLQLPAHPDLLKEFCVDFDEDIQIIFAEQVIQILANCEFTFKLIHNSNNKMDIIVTPGEEDILKKCAEYIKYIDSKTKLILKLEELLNKIDFYHYELYMCVLNLLNNFDCVENRKKWIAIISYLKKYYRVCQPDQREFQYWLEHFPHKNTVPNISQYRLPFIQFIRGNPWDVIKLELNVDNCESWFIILETLSFDDTKQKSKERFCLNAIKNSVMAVYRNNQTWSLSPQQDNLRKSCITLLQHVEDREMYAAILYFIMNYSATGIDKVIVSKMCYDFAFECADKEISLQNMEKLKKRYPLFASTHILHTHNINEPELCELLEQPEKLVKALYNHNSVIQRARGLRNEAPDINKAVKDIADIYPSLNLRLVQIELLETWLQPSESDPNLDDTFSMTVISKEENKDFLDMKDDNLIRVCYLLQVEPLTFSLKYLMAIAADPKYSLGTRFRSVQCVLSMAGPDELKKVMRRSYDELKDQLIKYFCLWHLERLGVSYSEEEFSSCNKESLVKGLLRMHSARSETGIVLISQICQSFQIENPQIWETVLMQMIDFNMPSEIGRALTWVTAKPHLRELSSVSKGWQVIIRSPFLKADIRSETSVKRPEYAKQEKECADAILLLQRSPLIKSMNLVDIAECCVKSGRPYMAAAILPLGKDVQRQAIKQMIKAHGSGFLEEDLVSLYEFGILFTKQALQILNSD